MKVLAFNGSPRKSWNTATLLKNALEGAEAIGAETELIHLYDLNFKGCKSCFACKMIGGKSYGRCAVQDDLQEIFTKVEEADALVFGSPIYLGRVSGEMAAFLDRLVFQYLEYGPKQTLFPKKMQSGFIYTMNITEEQMKQSGLESHFAFNTRILERTFGPTELLTSCNTYQFADYAKVVSSSWNVPEKTKQREEVFPLDCKKAFELGARLAAASHVSE
ncbi:flavodoxin family protein [Methanorbis rubei]|uniref:NADPH-dependent FMN reductase-like domain-containing protein n=1 Tax=Methanorbis rubei TaxID=3028300 RepID=A0AAE4MET6_9EURY|nr:hypothetical protein [Methanocorpusculaceae archaeon Cs1]